MLRSSFVFGSFDSADSDGKFYKLEPINFPTPEKDTISFEVPGRSGDLLVDFGSYKNVELEFAVEIAAKEEGDTFLTLYDELRTAIMVQSGYQRLEDSLYPDEYRMARAVSVEVGKNDTENGTAIITLDAKPQRYLTSGQSAAITIAPAASSLSNLIGYGTDLFNDDYKAVMEAQGAPVSGNYMCVDVLDYANRGYGMKLTYPDGTRPVMDDVYMPIGVAMYPFVGETYSFGYMANEYLMSDNTITHNIGGGQWCIFLTPLKAEIYQNNDPSDVVASILPASTIITPPVADLSYTPLIHFTVSGAVNSGVVLMLDDNVIGLNTPASIGGLSIADIYIDLETFNAYAISGGVTISLNKYVTLRGDFIFNGPITVYSNSNFDTCEIIPRWWKI